MADEISIHYDESLKGTVLSVSSQEGLPSPFCLRFMFLGLVNTDRHRFGIGLRMKGRWHQIGDSPYANVSIALEALIMSVWLTVKVPVLFDQSIEKGYQYT